MSAEAGPEAEPEEERADLPEPHAARDDTSEPDRATAAVPTELVRDASGTAERGLDGASSAAPSELADGASKPDVLPAAAPSEVRALPRTDSVTAVAAPTALSSPVGVTATAPNVEDSQGEVVPWSTILAVIGIVLGVGAAIELLIALQRVIEVLVIASFLAVVLGPAVSGLVRMNIRRGFATTIVFLFGMAAFGGLGYLFIHPLYGQAIQFADDLPGILAKAQAGKGRLGELIAHYHLQSTAATEVPKIRDYLSHLGGPALTIVRRVLSGLGGLAILMTLTFLLLLEGPTVVRGCLKVLPAPHARRARRVLEDVAKSVTGYMIGNFATSVIAGVICSITLLLLGVPFAFVFGVWVAMVDFLPLIGGLLAGVPTVAFAFLHSPTAGIVTLIVFLVYQQLENHVLNPVIMSRTVRLNALWVILSVLAGAELAGIIGALLAIPAAGTIHVIARDIWDERRGRLKVSPTVGPEATTIP